jgi:hypothetical protein
MIKTNVFVDVTDVQVHVTDVIWEHEEATTSNNNNSSSNKNKNGGVTTTKELTLKEFQHYAMVSFHRFRTGKIVAKRGEGGKRGKRKR